MRLRWPTMLVLFFGATVHAQSLTLCDGDENTIFSCQTGKKIVSLCASANLSASSGYLQYRFGSGKTRVELEYPKSKEHPKGNFLFGDAAYGARSSATNLQFSIGRYTYTVYRLRASFSDETAGIAVKDAAGVVSYLRCYHDRVTDHMSGLAHLGMQPIAEQQLTTGPQQ